MIVARRWISVGFTPAAGSSSSSSVAAPRARGRSPANAAAHKRDCCARSCARSAMPTNGAAPSPCGGRQLLVDRPRGLQQMCNKIRAEAQVKSHHHIVEHGQVAEQPDALERARDAQARHHGAAGCAPNDLPGDSTARLRSADKTRSSTFTKVLLPEPLGPMSPCTMPGRDGELDAIERPDAAEVLGRDRALRSRLARRRPRSARGSTRRARASIRALADGASAAAQELEQAAHDPVGQEDDRHQDDAAIDIEVVLVQMAKTVGIRLRITLPDQRTVAACRCRPSARR